MYANLGGFLIIHILNWRNIIRKISPCYKNIKIRNKDYQDVVFFSIVTFFFFSGYFDVSSLNNILSFREMLERGEDVAQCPSCSLIIRVIYDPDQFVKLETVSVPPAQAICWSRQPTQSSFYWSTLSSQCDMKYQFGYQLFSASSIYSLRLPFIRCKSKLRFCFVYIY